MGQQPTCSQGTGIPTHKINRAHAPCVSIQITFCVFKNYQFLTTKKLNAIRKILNQRYEICCILIQCSIESTFVLKYNYINVRKRG